MSVPFEIPTQPVNQKFSIFLSGQQYTLSFRWNKFSQSWSLDIFDVNNQPLANSLPLVTGADLLGQLEYLGIGGQMIVQSDGITDTVPNQQTLGSLGHLYYNVSDADAAEQVET